MASDDLYLPHVSESHVRTSADTLEEIASLVSTSRPADPRHTLKIRFGQFDHGGFLTPNLYGIAVVPIDEAGLLHGGAADARIMYGVIVNQTLETQIRAALTCIATYLARRGVLLELADGPDRPTGIDLRVAEADQMASSLVETSLKATNWRSTAKDLRERAVAGQFALEVDFANPLLDAQQIRNRVPAMRHVYNSISLVRSAVDRAANAIGAGMELVGDGISTSVLEQAQSLLDVSEVQRYSAHLYRDAAVCGNGHLLFDAQDGTPRLLRPEETVALSESRCAAVNADGSLSEIKGRALTFRGLHQPGSLVGASLMEPFMMPLSQLEIAIEVMDEAIPIAEQAGPREREWAQRTKGFAERTLQDFDSRVQEILGGGTDLLREPPPDLYFPGQERMAPALDRLEFVGESD